MTHPYDHINFELILALRAGHAAETSATLAHYTRGNDRRYHINAALEEADKVTAAAAKLREEIAAIEMLDAADRRTREMTAELPAAEREVLALKGMV